MQRRVATSLCHWGAFEAVVENGRLTEARPWPGGGADPDMIGAWPELAYGRARIRRPHVRRSCLERGAGAGGAGRGCEDMVPVDWDTALDLVASELEAVYRDHPAASVFGGSYGWSSAGRFHHARTQVRRFLAAAGGFTDQSGNYSWGAAAALLPHVLGDASAVSHAATGWDSIAEHSDALIAFGGLNPKNWRVTSGGAGYHHMPELVRRAADRGVRFVIISPISADIPPGIDALLIQPLPNTDTALILALAHEALCDDRADRAFLDRYTVGADRFIAYLRGADDNQPKTLEWAAGISGVPVGSLRELWRIVRSGRIMLTAAWSLQRARHGEQPYWALIALAAMLGQIGLPGGGFCFGFGSLNGVGMSARRGYVPAMPGLANPAASSIPAASVLDMLERPGETFEFNGRRGTYPDTRLIYWAGGNPFHHAQDLNRLEAAWKRPRTVIVHDAWWTATAQRADIVLPATTTLERNDIGGSSRDPFVFFMPKLIEPVGESRDDYAIFAELARRLGCHDRFTQGRDEEAWLRHLWSATRTRAARDGIDAPDYDGLRRAGHFHVPAPDEPEILLERFRSDPEANRLGTPSGRIELYSETIAGFGYDEDCPPRPAWIEPEEWLGAAAPDELHLLSSQPAKQLHGQLYQARRHNAPAPISLNPGDAAARGLRDGDIVRVFNGRGACLARLDEDCGLRQGVAIMPTGSWYAPGTDGSGVEQNGNPNVLTADRRTSRLGQGSAAQSVLVRVARRDPPVTAARTEE
ncbi:molybdopterin-dependent oxidoreductase [Pukyongiella litopenaei]|uniref:Molybdopterin-dependent oxidoreductase n=1 Tax=Pukyongiella litopenaei TaxID=2605946 RepID=A0A2S0MS22_9RHOB|nr:molybdopterin-dependent oxidoreductase [Pukyongiella litopenaei]AVO38656.1 molybdopterin-dependent oxidoreductase [Pukyongiella litopenaei]